MKKKIFIVTGFILCIAGIIGIFVPLLPVTPFLLGAALLFSKSSPKFYQKLYDNEYLGSFIKNYYEHCGVPQKTIYQAFALLWLSLATGIIFTTNIWLKLLLFIVGLAVSLHLFSLKKNNREPVRFTLIELLISIGVCSILLSMLLPAIQKTRSSGAKILCMNNLRQIGQALHMYSFDYEDTIPPLAYGLNGSCMVVKMNNVPIGLGHLIGNYGTMPENYGCMLNNINTPENVKNAWRSLNSAQNAYFYRFNDCGFNTKLSHDLNSTKAFLMDFCCALQSRPIIAHNFEDVNIAYVDGSVIRRKNSPFPGEFFTVSASFVNGKMQTSSENAWQNADR